MIKSMTAFARLSEQGDFGQIICEIRSINHRYLETSVYLPDTLRALEMPIREAIRHVVKRGKIECQIRYQAMHAQGSQFMINKALAKELCMACAIISEFSTNPAPVNPSEILRWPGVLNTQEVDLSILQEAIMQVLRKTLHELTVSREREGAALKQLFIQRLDKMREEIAKVRQRLPQIISEQRERLHKRLQEVKTECNPDRLELEMVMFVQRIDVSEEIDRLETHIKEVTRVLEQDDAMGRRLDFLLQELNREANTLGSKSVDSTTTHVSVELKVLIEQIREQVQNVE